jgi:quinol monooxygenase YgiN
MAASNSGLTETQPVARCRTRPSRKPVEVRGQVAGFLGLGDRVDLGAGVRDAGRVGLAVGAFQALPGAQAHDLGPALVQAHQAAVELVRVVRREPGCVTFTAYEARDTSGRFYLYEVYTDAAAFAAHLQTDHVHTFISAIPDLSTGGPGSLIQLNELTC